MCIRDRYETIKGKENREWVDSDKIPDTLKNAVVAIEDERFYKHHGCLLYTSCRQSAPDSPKRKWELRG